MADINTYLDNRRKETQRMGQTIHEKDNAISELETQLEESGEKGEAFDYLTGRSSEEE